MIEQAIEAVLEEAHRYLGVEEKPAGSNRGIEIGRASCRERV